VLQNYAQKFIQLQNDKLEDLQRFSFLAESEEFLGSYQPKLLIADEQEFFVELEDDTQVNLNQTEAGGKQLSQFLLSASFNLQKLSKL